MHKIGGILTSTNESAWIDFKLPIQIDYALGNED